MTAKNSTGKSLRWMISMLLLAVVGMGWGFAAAFYASDELSYRARPSDYAVGSPRLAGREGVGAFLFNAIAQIPEAPQVLSYTVRKRFWLPVVVCLLVGGVLLLGAWAKRLESQFAREDRKFCNEGGRT